MKPSRKNRKNNINTSSKTVREETETSRSIEKIEKEVAIADTVLSESKKITSPSSEKSVSLEKSSDKVTSQTLAARDTTKFILVASFIFLGFLFAFLTGFGNFDLSNGILYGSIGALGGFLVGIIPYVFIR